jgi:hypothetical protein
MSEKFLLLDHPTLKDVIRQLDMLDENPKRYGDYTGQYPDVSLNDKTVRNVGDAMKVVRIAPTELKRVPNEIGRVVIIGVTLDGENARVDIDPLKALDSLGTIFIGEETLAEEA